MRRQLFLPVRAIAVLDSARLVLVRMDNRGATLGAALGPWKKKVEDVVEKLEAELVRNGEHTPQMTRHLAHGALERVVEEIRNLGQSALQDLPQARAGSLRMRNPERWRR